MLIQNEAISNLLKEKGVLVEEGRKLSAEIEAEGRKIFDAEISGKGVKVEGDIYSGNYETLKDAFGAASLAAVDELVTAKMRDSFERLTALGNQVNVINEKVNDIITSDVLPGLTLGDFEIITNIDQKDDGIELSVVDVVERFKKSYLDKTKK